MAPKQLLKKSKPATAVGLMPYHLRALLGKARRGRRTSRKEEMKKKTAVSVCRDDAPQKKGEWDDVKCPMCQETPQKAILLHCSDGCQPYVCDTDYILTACFNRLCDSQKVQRPPKRDSDGRRPTSFEFPADGRRPSCPVCNCGEVTGWVVDEAGREAMNGVVRTCKEESWSCKGEPCGIRGSYEDFKDHARLMHNLSNYDVWWHKDVEVGVDWHDDYY